MEVGAPKYRDACTDQRIELRCADGPLLGVLDLASLRLEVKRGHRVFEVDILATLRTQEAVVLERVLRPKHGTAATQ